MNQQHSQFPIFSLYFENSKKKKSNKNYKKAKTIRKLSTIQS